MAEVLRVSLNILVKYERKFINNESHLFNITKLDLNNGLSISECLAELTIFPLLRIL